LYLYYWITYNDSQLHFCSSVGLFLPLACFSITEGQGGYMIKGLINSLVSDHLFVSELGKHDLEDESLDFYDVLHDKLEELTLAGNLPIFKGFYTEYLDEDESYDKRDDKYVIRNCVYLNERKMAA